MLVTNVERIITVVPFTPRQQEITAREVYNWNILEICKVSTDTGHVGWGETVIHYTWSHVTDRAVDKVMGKSPAEVMNDDTLGAGLQMALFDVVGKILEVPVHQILGEKVRDWVPISWWSIDASPRLWAEEAQEAVENGYTSFKLKPRPWWDINEQVDAINNVVPPHFKLDLDPNGTFQTAASAIPIIKKLERYDIVAMFETPILQDDVLGNRRIRQASDRPIAMHFGSPPYITAVREEVCDGFVICAGKSAIMKQAALSAEAKLPFWLQLVGNGLTSTWAAHLGAVLTHATWPAITCMNLYSHPLLKKKIDVIGGYHEVPNGPGLGVEVDEEAVERFRVSDEELAPFKEKGNPYKHPEPRVVITIVYANGGCIHLASAGQRYEYFMQLHNGPAQAEGTRLELWHDDGSKEWSELFARAQKHPVRDRFRSR
jgi:L-alanine-DL-glutamate epimerase-like enolase superfamily enzyme